MGKHNLNTNDYGLHNLKNIKKKLIIDSIKKKYVTNDTYCKQLELKIKRQTNSKYCVVCNSGTSALFISLLALKNKTNIIAIIPNINFVSVANIVYLLKGKVVLCDIDKNSGMVSLDEFKNIIKKCGQLGIKPNVFIPIHYAGATPDLSAISKICEKKKIKIIEDACHSFGSTYDNGEKVGSSKHSSITTFSFHPLKNITTIEGGAITTNNQRLYKKILELRSFSLKRTSIVDPYKMNHPSLNFRMGEINAAIGLDQINKVNQFRAKRQKLVQHYLKKLKNYEKHFSILNINNKKIFWHLFVIFLKNRSLNYKKKFMNYLKKNKIASQIHYKPLMLHQSLKKITLFSQSSNSKKFYISQLTIPLHTNMNLSDINYISKKIGKFFKYNIKS